ncbi:hypothetical protein GCM10009799_35640 [Nocardiopsis rhodophaea]|uniref:Uncharacterized protein n=1 Tax=Nocardiopsis rhodophaea TaxID=280238 RepID=A0ABP5EQP3_9ACTN
MSPVRSPAPSTRRECRGRASRVPPPEDHREANDGHPANVPIPTVGNRPKTREAVLGIRGRFAEEEPENIAEWPC